VSITHLDDIKFWKQMRREEIRKLPNVKPNNALAADWLKTSRFEFSVNVSRQRGSIQSIYIWRL